MDRAQQKHDHAYNRGCNESEIIMNSHENDETTVENQWIDSFEDRK